MNMGNHFRRHHPGETPAMLVQAAVSGGVHWKCPLCPAAIPQSAVEGVCRNRIQRDINEHKRLAHPRLPWKVWKHKRAVAKAAKAAVTRP